MPKGIKGFQKGHPSFLSPEDYKNIAAKVSIANFKGDKAGKEAMHLWVAKWKGKPSKCEMCGTENAKNYEWANVDHSYKRILDDYIRMCRSCHRNYDIRFNKYRAGESKSNYKNLY